MVRLRTAGSGARTADFGGTRSESTVSTETRGLGSGSVIAGWGSGAALLFARVGAAASSTSWIVIFWAASSCNRIPTSYGSGRSPTVQWLMHLGERESNFASCARDRPSTVGIARNSSRVIVLLDNGFLSISVAAGRSGDDAATSSLTRTDESRDG